MFLRKIAAPSGSYSVSKSLRFRSSASAYLNRTLGTSTNGQKFTWSGWVKRGKLGILGGLQHGYSASNNQGGIYFNTGDTLNFADFPTSSNANLVTTALYRDPFAWYHIVVAADTTQATASNRVLMYVNGVQITSFSTATYPAQNTVLNINKSANTGLVGQYYDGTNNYFDGYMAEVNFIDGQALTPSSFGTYDANGVWQPIKYSGTYGTNGFYLNFGNTTSTTTLGYDTSGNSNNWTTNNISLTAGTTYDSMTDSPTVSSATVANYATLNPLDFQNANTYSNGNLSVSLQAATASMAFAGFGLQSGKWYWEVKTTAGTDPMLGVATQAGTLASRYWNGANSVYYYGGSGTKYVAGTGSAYGATYGTADTIGIALDLSANTITYYKNNASQGAISLPSQLLGVNIVPAFSSGTGTAVQSMNVNFGQQPFTYTPPTGFNALNTYNLPAPTIANGAQYMAATTYTGTGATQTISDGTNTAIGTTFQPDLVWLKSRSAATDHALYDVVRGTTLDLASNTTAAETTQSTGLTAFGSTGFTIGALAKINTNAATYVGWQWKANGAGVSNTNGSITSTVSANTTAGFSIVTYTGTGANATVGHGLGVAPNLIIWKNRSAVQNWVTYHSSLGAAGNVYLNLGNAYSADSTTQNNTAPTSSVFTVATSGAVNGSTNSLVAYCWAAVSGYSAFGSYTGNGSTDGPFVYTGFRPRFLLVKRTDTVESWNIVDTSRDTYNQAGTNLYPNLGNAESTNNLCDLLSNGFKLRNTWTGANTSGGTYIYAAFAENPFNSSRAR